MKRRLLHLTERHIFVLCIASALARLAFFAAVKPSIPVAEDYAIALHLVGGEGFSIYERGPTSIKGPVYPSYLAAWMWLLGVQSGLQWAIIFQHLLYAAMPWILTVLGKAISRPALGMGAAVLFALHPTYFYHATVAENTTWVVVMSAIWAILVFGSHPRPMLVAVAVGVILGIFVLEKPPLVMPMLVTVGIRWWRQWQRLATVAISAAILILPWAVRGAIVFGEPTLTKSYAGYVAFIHSWLPRMAVHSRYAVADSIEHQLDSLMALPEREALPAIRSMASGILSTTWSLLPERTILHALIYWSIPPRYWHTWSLSFILVRIVPVVVLTLLLGWGTRVLWRCDRQLLLSVLGILAWTTLVYSLYHVLNIRFKLEVEWLQLLICAAPFAFNRRGDVYSACCVLTLLILPWVSHWE